MAISDGCAIEEMDGSVGGVNILAPILHGAEGGESPDYITDMGRGCCGRAPRRALYTTCGI